MHRDPAIRLAVRGKNAQGTYKYFDFKATKF